jgi:hypothetical protein
VLREIDDGGLDVGEVRAVLALALRGADADEVDVGEVGDGLDVGGEAQAARLEVLLEQLGQARFVDRQHPRRERLDLGGVDVVADHLVSQLREADRVGDAEVPAPDEGDAGPCRGVLRGGVDRVDHLVRALSVSFGGRTPAGDALA